MIRRGARSFAGSHVLVTGGSSGIGRAIVDRLVAFGAVVSVLALDDADLARLIAEQPTVSVVPCDVTSLEDVRAAVASLAPVARLISCAGITKPGYAVDLTDADYRGQMEVNYFGTLNVVRACLPSVIAARGSITCISSAAGLLGVFGYAAYVPSKFAVRGLCETLRVELRPRGVSVTCVFPPDVNTPMLVGETPLKPPELVALSGAIKPLEPSAVAASILVGTLRGSARVIPDVQTRGLRLLAGAVPGVVEFAMDRIVAKAQRAMS